MPRVVSEKSIEESEEIQRAFSRIKWKLLVMSGKGGVGKSTVAVNTAVSLSYRGYAVGLMDTDLHGPDTLLMTGLESVPVGVEENKIVPLRYNENLEAISIASALHYPDNPVIWRGPMKFGIIRQFITDVAWGDLDYLIIDSPPGTDDELLAVARYFPGSKSIIVTTPQAASILDVRKAVSFCWRLSIPVLGVIENMSGLSCPYCGKKIELFGSGGGRKAARDMDIPFLGAIPLDPEVNHSGDIGTPVVAGCPDSDTTAAIDQIVQRVIETCGSLGEIHETA
jgi:Mrp family chromosome partitioning ATPase